MSVAESELSEGESDGSEEVSETKSSVGSMLKACPKSECIRGYCFQSESEMLLASQELCL